jgi:hypothetical protein
MTLGAGRSWEMRAEMLRRALDDPVVQGGEASMAGHLRRIDKGDRSHVGLPVFPLRNFTARDLYVRKGGPVKSPADLAGKRVGMYDWVVSGSIWYRHFLGFNRGAAGNPRMVDRRHRYAADGDAYLHAARGGVPAGAWALLVGHADRR